MSLMSAGATVTIHGFGPPTLVRVDVDLDGEPLSLELAQPDGMTAAGWSALDAFLQLFPGALPADQRAYWHERLADPADPLNMKAARAIAYRVADLVYGMPWWAAHRLTSRAAGAWWQYEAWTVDRGFDPRGASAARIAASCWAWAAAGCQTEAEGEALHREVFASPLDPVVGHDDKLARNQAMLARLQAGRSG